MVIRRIMSHDVGHVAHALDGLGPGGPAPSGSFHNNSALGGPAPGGPAVLPETWRIILARMQPGVIKFVQDKKERCVTGQSSDYVATDPRKEGVEGWKGL
jgi:hypothetical protein